MKALDLRKKSRDELEKEAENLRKKLSDIRFRFSSNKLKDIKEASNIKKEIARILTVLKNG